VKFCGLTINFLREIYETESLLLNDENSVLAGLLVGLNVLNCNLCLKIKNEDFDEPVITEQTV
jgi:hypothetical protein